MLLLFGARSLVFPSSGRFSDSTLATCGLRLAWSQQARNNMHVYIFSTSKRKKLSDRLQRRQPQHTTTDSRQPNLKSTRTPPPHCGALRPAPAPAPPSKASARSWPRATAQGLAPGPLKPQPVQTWKTLKTKTCTPKPPNFCVPQLRLHGAQKVIFDKMTIGFMVKISSCS